MMTTFIQFTRHCIADHFLLLCKVVGGDFHLMTECNALFNPLCQRNSFQLMKYTLRM